MSRPKANPIADLISRFLQVNEGKNSSEVGRAVGLDPSYVSRWRAGDIPTRLQETTRKKLAAAVGQGEPRDDGSAVAFAAGVLWKIEQDALHMAKTAGEARRRLGFENGSVPAGISPAAARAALDEGEQMIRDGEKALAAKQQAHGAPKGARRPA